LNTFHHIHHRVNINKPHDSTRQQSYRTHRNDDNYQTSPQIVPRGLNLRRTWGVRDESLLLPVYIRFYRS